MAITLSDTAAERVKQFMATRHDAVGLRVGIKTTGCSGFAYVVDLTDTVDSEDRVYESQGISVIVDPKSLSYIDGTIIDFARDGLNEGFTYDNPNVKSLCGCGESFGI